MGAEGTKHVATFTEEGDLDPSFGEVCIDLARQAMFPAAWCAEIGISTGTFRSWRSRYPEFREVTDRAKTILQSQMEAKAVDALGKRGFQGTVWRAMMQAHFPEDYTQRTETVNRNVNHDGGPERIEDLTDEELDARAEAVVKARRERKAAAQELEAKRAAQAAAQDGDAGRG